MYRLYSSSVHYFTSMCKYVSLRKGRSCPLYTDRAGHKLLPIKGPALYQHNRTIHNFRRITTSLKFTQLRFWIFGLGTGSLLVWGIKNKVDVGEFCECESKTNRNGHYEMAIEASREQLQRIKDEVGAPGIVVGVAVDGVPVWSEGLGYSDLENRVPCRPETMMRVASISKPLTTAAVGRLWEKGRLNLDAPVQKYVPEFPEKHFEGEAVTITTRMLLSHLSGIRHYEKDAKKVRDERNKEKAKQSQKALGGSKKEDKNAVNKGRKEESSEKGKENEPGKRKEFEQEEYYIKERYDSVIQALDLFKNDPLIFKPGTTFLYSTHAFTLLSAVVERAAGQPFLDHMMKMFRELGMLSTIADQNDPIIYHRSRYYHFSKKSRIINCPYVDNSYKWAGGGFLSTVGDLLLFGNAMLYSYQVAHSKGKESLLPGFLKPQTAANMWSPVDKTKGSVDKDGCYAMGWLVVERMQEYGQCRKRRHYISHSGGAVGASSVLLVLPSELMAQEEERAIPPSGVVVAIMTNMQSVGLQSTALRIAQEFDKARDE